MSLPVFVAIAAAFGGEALSRGFGLPFVLWSGVAVVVVAAVYLAVLWSMAMPVFLAEETSIRQALVRSRSLVGGNWWRVFGIALVFVLLAGVLAGFVFLAWTVITGVLAGFSAGLALAGAPGIVTVPLMAVAIVVSLVGAVIGATVFPLLTIPGWVLLYYDLRMRKEGFDLEFPASQGLPQPEGEQPGDRVIGDIGRVADLAGAGYTRETGGCRRYPVREGRP